jgi:hypothetical protein
VLSADYVYAAWRMQWFTDSLASVGFWKLRYIPIGLLLAIGPW